MRRKNRINKRKIAFEALFEPSLKRKVEAFLESGKPAATLTKGILIVAALGGVLAVGIMAPNLFRVFGMNKSERSNRITYEGYRHLRRSFYHVKKEKFVESIVMRNGVVKWRLTELGKERLRYALGEKVTYNPLPKLASWDGKYRVVLFDIPENHIHGRNALRYAMQSLGFYQFQKSAWVHPFQCKREITEIASRFDIKQYVKVFTMEDFYDNGATAHFHSLLKDIPRYLLKSISI